MDRRFRALALKTSLKSFGKAFTLKDEALQAKEFAVEIGGKERRCILYYSEEKAERDKKSRDIRLARIEDGLGEVAASLTREGAGRKPTRNGIERRIVLLLEKNHCERLIDWRLVGGRGGRRLKWELNQAVLKEEEILDRRYWLMTTLDVSPKEVLTYTVCQWRIKFPKSGGLISPLLIRPLSNGGRGNEVGSGLDGHQREIPARRDYQPDR